MKWKVLLALVICYFLLMVLGGVVFHFLETRNEEEVRLSSNIYIEEILRDRPCLSREDVMEFMQTVIQAYDQGVHPLSNDTQTSNWNLASAIFFAGTVGTTIGYGNISPATLGGRIFCVFFALISIPVCLVMLAGIGEKMNDGIKKFNQKMDRCQKHVRLGKILRTLFVVCVGIIVFLFIPAAIFSAIEQWTFTESMYYAFITLTTVGFGDYVVGANPDIDYKVPGFYRICCWFWIILGLAWLSLVISMGQDLFENIISKVERQVEHERDKDRVIVNVKQKQSPNASQENLAGFPSASAGAESHTGKAQ